MKNNKIFLLFKWLVMFFFILEARVRRSICIPNPCKNSGYCTITGTSTGNYTCSCAGGWKGANCVGMSTDLGISLDGVTSRFFPQQISLNIF